MTPLLWKIRNLPVHFMGSMHFGPNEGYQIPSAIYSAFDSAEVCIFEVDDIDVDHPPTFLARATGTLADDLPVSLYKKLTQDPRFGPQFDQFNLEAAVLVLGAGEYLRLGFTPTTGVDVILCKRARQNQRVVAGLETRQDQLRALLASPHEESLALLQLMLEQPELGRQMASAIVQAFEQGDTIALRQMRSLLHKIRPIGALAILEQREARWLPVAQEAIQSGRSIFFTVGALHVAQENGIVSLVEKAGHTLDRCI